MTFPLTPATPFTASVSTISAATANDWRTYISQSLDTVNGGAYVNVTSIDWSAGGAGWRFYAALAIKSTGTLTLDAGATVTINADPSLFGTMRVGLGGAGGGVRWYATSTLTIDDTVAVSNAGDNTLTSASTTTYQAGSGLAINTALATVGTAATLTVNGSSGGGNTATVAWGQYSTQTHASESSNTYSSGATHTINAGAFVTWTIGSGVAGSLTLDASSTFTVTAGAAVTMSVGGGGTPGTLTINADGTLTTSASSVFNQGGTTTRTGALTLSGTGASTSLRYYAAPTGTYSIDPKHYDRIYRTSAGGFANVLTLTPDPGASEFIELFITYVENAGSSLELRDATATLIDTLEFSTTTENKVCAHIIWTGTFWRVLCKTFFS